MFARAFLLLVLCLAAAPSRAEVPRVIASIKPLQSLAANVMAGVGEPAVLIRGAGSAHAYSLRPSEAKALARADVIFWIGPQLETFLEGPVKNLGQKAAAVALAQTPGLVLQPNRPPGLWGEAVASVPGTDGHLWLDPRNAKVIVAAMAEALARHDAANAARYRANAQAAAARIDLLDGELASKLAPVRAKPFIIYHDAYHGFEAHYGLAAAGAVTVNPERPPSPGVVSAIRQYVAKTQGICVFAEPQFEPKLIQALVAGTTAHIGVLDPEASTLETGPDLYSNLLRSLTDNLVRCLSAP